MGGIGDFVKGAGGGALAGGGLGGPMGAIIGGIGGGIAGLFGRNPQDEQNARWQEFYNSLNKPQAANLAQESSFRGNQQQLVNQLQALATGGGPSLATQMIKTATDRNVAQQQALSQSGVGNATAAAQGAANNSARLGAQSTQDAVSARIAEQINAINSLGGVLQGARGQDQALGMFNADAQNSLAARLLQGRLAALQGMQGNVVPSLSDQILAGGAGLFSMGATQSALGVGGAGGAGGGQTAQVPSVSAFSQGPGTSQGVLNNYQTFNTGLRNR